MAKVKDKVKEWWTNGGLVKAITVYFIGLIIGVTMISFSIDGYQNQHIKEWTADWVITQYDNNGGIIEQWDVENTYLKKSILNTNIEFKNEDGNEITLIENYKIERIGE